MKKLNSYKHHHHYKKILHSLYKFAFLFPFLLPSFFLFINVSLFLFFLLYMYIIYVYNISTLIIYIIYFFLFLFFFRIYSLKYHHKYTIMCAICFHLKFAKSNYYTYFGTVFLTNLQNNSVLQIIFTNIYKLINICTYVYMYKN